MKTWKIGEVICDMHYGLPEYSWYPEHIPLECRNHVRVATDNSSDMLNKLLEGVGSDRDTMVTNKHAVVISYPSFDGWMTAAYSYDNRYFGMFEFRILHKE